MKRFTVLLTCCCLLMLAGLQPMQGQTLTRSDHDNALQNGPGDQLLVPSCFEFNDQVFVGSSVYNLGLSGTQALAQSFVAGAKGRLISAAVDIQVNACTETSTFNFVAELLQGDGWNGAVLASAEVQLNIPYTRAMLEIDFPYPVTVYPGESYTLKLTPRGGQVCYYDLGDPIEVYGTWYIEVPDPYAQGVSYANGNPYPYGDLYFLTTINPNSALNIEVTACNHYYWSASGLTYYMSGTHQAAYNNSVGCDSVVTLYLTINDVDASAVQTDPYTLQAVTSGAQYQWLDCEDNYAAIGGANDQTFFPGLNGRFAVEVTKDGCTDTSACLLITAYGIPENSFGNALEVYPNPTSGRVTVNLGDVVNQIRVKVYNTLGSLISEKQFSNAEKIETETGQAPGLYLINLYAADGRMASVRVLKE